MGNDFTFTSAKGEVFLKGTFLLDAATIPRQVTWIGAGGSGQGRLGSAIYSISENEFVVVYAQNGAAKPTDFRADVGQVMRRFARRPQRLS